MSGLEYPNPKMTDFTGLITRLKNSTDDEQLYSVLTSLNDIFYPLPGLETKHFDAFFDTVLNSKPLHKSSLIVKWTHLIHTLLTTQNASLSPLTASNLIAKISSLLSVCEDPVEPLYAMSALIPHADLQPKVGEQMASSVSPVFHCLSDNRIPVQRAALDCFCSLCHYVEISPLVLNGLLEVLVQLLNDTILSPQPQIALLHMKFQFSILRAMLNILSCVGSLQPLPQLPTLLALLKALMTTGLPGHRIPQVPAPLSPHPDTVAVSTEYRSPSVAGPRQKRPRKRGGMAPQVTKTHQDNKASTPLVTTLSGSEGEGSDKGEHRRGRGGGDGRRRGGGDGRRRGGDRGDRKNFIPSSTSESELSDSDPATGSSSFKDVTKRIRHNSLLCLATIFQSLDRHSAFSYGLPFLPDSPRPPSSPPTIFTCLCKDPIYKCRSAVSIVLTAILEGSRPFMAVADDRPASARPFTPYSITLGGVIQELHRSLLLSLTLEHLPLTLTHILRCLSILIVNSPYSTLSNHYISTIVSTIKPLTTRSDTDVAVGALTCYGAILSLNPPVSDVEVWLKEDTPPGGFPWIVDHCKDLVKSFDTAQSLKMEAIQVLTAVIKFNMHAVRHSWSTLSQLYCSYMYRFPEPLQQHSLRYLEELGKAVGSFNEGNMLSEMVTHWESVMKDPLTSWLQSGDKFPSSCSQGCSVLATIGNSILAAIKSSAIRSLGVFCQYPYLSDDAGFLMDCAERLKKGLAISEQLSVRTQAGWAVGNLTDSFHSEESRVEVLPILFPSLVDCTILAMKDNEKVKVNAVRASGNLLKILNPEVLKHCNISRMGDMCSLLIESVNSGGMKTRWNACYACHNALKNPCFVDHDQDCVKLMLKGLCTAATTCKNFKVRTNSVLALGSLVCFPSHDEFISVWNALLKAPESTTEQHDFAEYKQANALKHQVCVSLCEVITKMESTILPKLSFSLPLLICSELTHFVQQQKQLVGSASSSNSTEVDLITKACEAMNRLDKRLLEENKGMSEVLRILEAKTEDKTSKVKLNN